MAGYALLLYTFATRGYGVRPAPFSRDVNQTAIEIILRTDGMCGIELPTEQQKVA